MDTFPVIRLPKKPHYQKITQKIDFFKLFCHLEKNYSTCFFLESLGEEGHLARYSVIGFNPEITVKARNNTLTFTQNKKEYSFQTINPYYALRELIPQNILSREYAGGLVGYLSYEAMNYFEPTINLTEHPLFEPFKFGVYTDGLILDKQTGEINYFYYNYSRLPEIDQHISNNLNDNEDLKEFEVTDFHGDSMTKAEHSETVLKVKEMISLGRIYQAEVGFKTTFSVKGSAINLYDKLREVNPSSFMAYVKFDDQIIVSASPEALFRLRQGEMSVYPLAGTAPRGKTQPEDLMIARELLNNPKERSEHIMLVDLHRNDLGRIAEFGTVRVRSFMDIKRFRYVQHIGSEVVGIIKKGEDMFSGLACNFPMGTVTGAPKIEAMRVIAENESEPRGLYAGGLGHFGFNGDCTFSVLLRSFFIHKNYGYSQTCGGNVFDSDPELEYQEIKNKLLGIKTTLRHFRGKDSPEF
jgi:anthranilate synthase component I